MNKNSIKILLEDGTTHEVFKLSELRYLVFIAIVKHWKQFDVNSYTSPTEFLSVHCSCNKQGKLKIRWDMNAIVNELVYQDLYVLLKDFNQGNYR